MNKNWKVFVVGTPDEDGVVRFVRDSNLSDALTTAGFKSSRFVVIKAIEDFDEGTKGKRRIGGSAKMVTETYFENQHENLFRQFNKIIIDEDYVPVAGSSEEKPLILINGLMEGTYGKKQTAEHYIVKRENGVEELVMANKWIAGELMKVPSTKNWVDAFIPGNGTEDDLNIELAKKEADALAYQKSILDKLAPQVTNELIQEIAEERKRELLEGSSSSEDVEVPPVVTENTNPPTATPTQPGAATTPPVVEETVGG